MIKRLLLFMCVIVGIGYATRVQGQVCTGPLSVTIAGSGTGLPLTFVSATVTTPIPCNGGTATVTLVVSGGTTPYAYTFNSTTNATGVFTGVSAGMNLAYSITDANSCGPITGTITVPQPTQVMATITETDNSGTPDDMIICPGGSANLTASGSGGTGAFTYAWSPNIGSGAGPHSVSPSSTTTYNVTVTDANGCIATANKEIVVNPALSASIAETDNSGTPNDMIICPGGSANLTASGSGGTGAFTYAWSPNIGSGAGPHTVSPSSTTTYNVTVTDANGCIATANKEIVVNPALSASIAETDNSGTPNDMIICPGGSANLTASGSGGTGAFTYAWSPNIGSGAGPHTVSPSSTTTYNVTVTDANGCIATANKEIVVNPALSASIAETDNSGTPNDMIICPGGSANLTASGSGGTGAFTYAWSPNIGSGAGPHTVSPSSTTTYNVTVTDANGCIATANKEIVVNPALSASIAETDNSGTPNDMIICPGGSANLTASGSGGTGAFTYAWSPNIGSGAGPHTVSPSSTTTYNVTVTDANGCIATANKEIVVNPALSASIAETDNSGTPNDMIICPGGSANLTASGSGGTGAFTYAWSPNIGSGAGPHTVSPSSTTTYNVTVTDANGCIATANKEIVVNPALSASIAETDNSGTPDDMIICPGDAADLTASGSGGTGAYSYTWSPNIGSGAGPHTVTPGSTTIFNVTITDANGCIATANKTITVNPALNVSALVTSNHNGAHVSCAAGQGTSNDGEITVSASGGTPGYIYSKDNGSNYQGSNVFTGLTAGTYTIVVKDANGCTTSTTVSVVAPPAIVAGTCTNADDKCQVSAGAIKVSASGGTGLLNITWTATLVPPFTGPATGSPAGTAQPVPNTPGVGGFIIYSGLSGNTTYNFTVTDANGCKVP